MFRENDSYAKWAIKENKRELDYLLFMLRTMHDVEARDTTEVVADLVNKGVITESQGQRILQQIAKLLQLRLSAGSFISEEGLVRHTQHEGGAVLALEDYLAGKMGISVQDFREYYTSLVNENRALIREVLMHGPAAIAPVGQDRGFEGEAGQIDSAAFDSARGKGVSAKISPAQVAAEAERVLEPVLKEREQVEKAIGFGRLYVTQMAEVVVEEAEKYQAASEISEADYERTLGRVKTRRLEIAETQGQTDPGEAEIARVLQAENRPEIEGFGSTTVADNDIPGAGKELFEKISAAVAQGRLDPGLQDGSAIFEREYRFTGRDGREQVYAQRIMGSVESGGFRVTHAFAAQTPEILAYLARLWLKINDKNEKNIEQKKRALAEFEWWFFQCNPYGRAGASIGDAMSMVAQIALGIKLREGFVRQDLVALSSTLEDYVAQREKEFQIAAVQSSSTDKNGPGGSVPSQSSGTAPESGKAGGIDLRSLPIVTRPAIGTQPQVFGPGQGIANDKEWGEIEKMLNSGIAPSIERIREYLASSCTSADCQARRDRALSCVADILKMEEERCLPTEEALKQLLVILDSDRPADDLKLALAKIKVLPKLPETTGK
jgi:hypothetical protein